MSAPLTVEQLRGKASLCWVASMAFATMAGLILIYCPWQLSTIAWWWAMVWFCEYLMFRQRANRLEDLERITI